MQQTQPRCSCDSAAANPDAVVFNGYVSQYTFRPLTARTGQRVRIWVLDAGPNRGCAFHIVGAPFDTSTPRAAASCVRLIPAAPRSSTSPPGSGGFVETVFTQPGAYPFLDHTLADADRGARGAIQISG